jgi:uncharacterized protein (DUF1330 family)
MNKLFTHTTVVAITAILSSGLTWYLLTSRSNDDAVYVIGAVTITDPERLPEYQAIAQPLARQAGGYEPLAFSEPVMIEGERPTVGKYFVERFDSRDALKGFLESAEYREAKVLRDEVADVHFLLAIDPYR